jgi:hypothetical protein
MDEAMCIEHKKNKPKNQKLNIKIFSVHCTVVVEIPILPEPAAGDSLFALSSTPPAELLFRERILDFWAD